MLRANFSMKLEKQGDTFAVTDVTSALTSAETIMNKHGPLLPSSIRGIICGPSGCGKTNVMYCLLTNPMGLRYANLYIVSKTLEQPKYSMLQRIIKGVPEIGYFTYNTSEDIIPPEEAMTNSIVVFDDVVCDTQDRMRAYFSMGRHRGLDCFYLTQTYTRVPKHLLRDNCNFIILFKQDDLNLKHVYVEHVNSDMTFERFKELCTLCWDKDDRGFVLIDKTRPLNDGRYRCGLDTFVKDIK